MRMIFGSVACVAIGLACHETSAQFPPPPRAAEATDSIRRDLESREPSIRIEALRRSGDLGREGKDYLAQVTEAVRQTDPAVQLEAIVALGRIGPVAASAAPNLVTILANESNPPVLRLAAIEALRQINARNDGVLGALEGVLKNKELGVAAARAIATVDPDRKNVEPLIRILVAALSDDQHAARRREAAVAFALLGQPAVDAALPLLKYESSGTRAAAAAALAGCGPQGGAAAEPLTQLLNDQDSTVRREAAIALGRIGVRSESALKGVEKLLSDDKPDVQAGALEALSRLAELEPLPESLLQKLGEALGSSDPDVSAKAATVLENSGPAALKTLSKQLENEQGRALAAAVIGQIAEANQGKLTDQEDILSQLVGLIRAKATAEGQLIPDETTRDAVLRAVTSLAPSVQGDEKLESQLQQVLLDPAYKGRAVAALAYGRIAGKKAIPTLKQTASNQGDKLLQVASTLSLLILEKDNPQSASASVSQLMKLLQEGGLPEELRERILEAIRNAGPQGLPRVDPRMAKQVADMLRDESPRVRVQAITLLAELRQRVDPLAQQVIAAALRLGRLDPDPDVRSAARNALGEK